MSTDLVNTVICTPERLNNVISVNTDMFDIPFDIKQPSVPTIFNGVNDKIVVRDQQSIIRRLKKFKPFIDHLMSDNDKNSGVYPCGGIILNNIIMADAKYQSQFENQMDVDFFVVSVNRGDFEKVVRSFLEKIIKMSNGGMTAYITTNSISIKYMVHKIQLICKEYKSILDVLTSFDLGPCQCVYDGENILITNSCWFSLKYGAMIDREGVRSSSYISRLNKYFAPKKGAFHLCMPKLDISKLTERKGMEFHSGWMKTTKVNLIIGNLIFLYGSKPFYTDGSNKEETYDGKFVKGANSFIGRLFLSLNTIDQLFKENIELIKLKRNEGRSFTCFALPEELKECLSYLKRSHYSSGFTLDSLKLKKLISYSLSDNKTCFFNLNITDKEWYGENYLY